MINFKTYYTEATKKDILAGLDANVNSIKKAQEYTDKAMALRKHFNDIDKKYPRWKAVKTEDKVDYIENKKNKHIQEENEKYLEQKMYELFDHLVVDPFPSRDRYTFYTYLTPYILTLDYYYDNGDIIPLPRETERAKEMINLLFFSVLKYKEVGKYFYDNLKKIDRKYQVGYDADELGELDDDQEINEATKKNILSGLDKIATDYKKELESRAVMFRFSYGSYDQEDALSGIIVPKMPKGVEKMNRPRYFYYGEDPDTLYSVHPVVLKFYDGLENDFEGMDPQEAQDLLFEFHALVEDAYRNAFGQDPDEDEETGSTTKKDILSGLNKIYSIRDPNDPYNQNVYGEIYFDSDGLFVDDKKYETPKKLPPNCEYIAKGAFIKKGQTPDYNKTFPFVYITDKKLMDTFSSTYGEESFHTNPITVEFIDELYTNLRLQTNDGHYRSGAPHLP